MKFDQNCLLTDSLHRLEKIVKLSTNNFSPVILVGIGVLVLKKHYVLLFSTKIFLRIKGSSPLFFGSNKDSKGIPGFFSILETVHGMEGQQIGFWTRESTPFFVLVRLLSLDNGGVTAWPNQSRVHVVLLENNKEEKSSYFFRCEKGGMTSPMPFFHFGSYPKVQAFEKKEEEEKCCQWITRTNSSGQSLLTPT